jgi:RNA polymerase sigma-70 factor (ECF subfamily)
MTSGQAQTHRPVAEDEFEALVRPHLRALHVHCYRMSGSLHEAEDLVQETLLRAWRRLDTYAGRASFAAWLYGIATNACLDARRSPRLLPSSVVDPDDPTAMPAPPRADLAWFEPYPDRLLDPAAELDQRESVRLAFVAAVQHLPPRQRAVLLLREVLGWSAREVAELLGTTDTSVNSALQRARASLEVEPLERAPDAAEAAIVARYVAAWNAADVAGLAALLREDVEMAMPPTPSWYHGRDALTAFFEAHFTRFPAGRLRLVPTRANGMPAFGVYDGDTAFAIKVLDVDRMGIRTITGFADASLFRFFDL